MYKFSQMNESNLNDMVNIVKNAYPGVAANITAEGMVERSKRPNVKYHCVHSGDKQVGGFLLWDFEMNARQLMIKVGGIGSVAVDLCHKKEKICREILRYFIDNLRDSNINMAVLYPFNSAFYYKMGFGFGNLLQQFRLKPEDLPGGSSKSHIAMLSENNATELAKFYNSRVALTHGLMTKTANEFAISLKLPDNKVVAYVKDGVIRGYLAFQFKKASDESFLANDMVVSELLFDSPEVFAELMAFLKSQSDQVRYVIVNTQDDGFIYSVADPRNHMDRVLTSVYQECCRTGLGLMYRICDVDGFFSDMANCRFGNLTMTLRLNVNDSFVSENNRAFILKFDNGLCTVSDGKPDAELNIGIAELSSMVMGCANLTQLVKYAKATISDERWLDPLSRAFSLEEKPVCYTVF